jgi:hypothetical protein
MDDYWETPNKRIKLGNKKFDPGKSGKDEDVPEEDKLTYSKHILKTLRTCNTVKQQANVT